MDWFKGHLIGTPNISWEYRWFPEKKIFAQTNQSIDYNILQLWQLWLATKTKLCELHMFHL